MTIKKKENYEEVCNLNLSLEVPPSLD